MRLVASTQIPSMLCDVVAVASSPEWASVPLYDESDHNFSAQDESRVSEFVVPGGQEVSALAIVKDMVIAAGTGAAARFHT